MQKKEAITVSIVNKIYICASTAILFFVVVGCAREAVFFCPEWAQCEYFSSPPYNDMWKKKIVDWQKRETDARLSFKSLDDASTSLGEDLKKLLLQMQKTDFSKHETIEKVIEWWNPLVISGAYSQRDENGDYWRSSLETIQKNGDDCDGVAALLFRVLLLLGIPPNELYMGIVFDTSMRRQDNHHMIVFWFDNLVDADPFVIDSTGAVTNGKIVRFSKISDWEILRIFNKTDIYAVQMTSPNSRVSSAK